jgi:hypothetical protein
MTMISHFFLLVLLRHSYHRRFPSGMIYAAQVFNKASSLNNKQNSKATKRGKGTLEPGRSRFTDFRAFFRRLQRLQAENFEVSSAF